MKLRDIFKSFLRRKPIKENVLQQLPIAEVDSQSKSVVKNFILKAFIKANTIIVGREKLVAPEYDLEEIRIASDADSYIKASLAKHSTLIYKAGYRLKSENERASEYIRRRFNYMGIMTGIPMDILFQEVGDDLITYSNAFLLKIRKNDVNISGFPKKGVLADAPVCGYYRLDPCNVYMQLDKSGRIKEYVYRSGLEEQRFNRKDVIHFYKDRKAGNLFGTPYIIATLEDVKLLRRTEGEALALIYRFSSPLYHYKVGLPETGMQATDTEIDRLKREVMEMYGDGSLITNERTEIKVLGAEGNAIDVVPYLQYFERRVFTGLLVSESQMGRGGNKYDAESMEAQAHDMVKYIQRIMSTFIENFMILELLLEGGFDPLVNIDDMVEYEFNEISLETKIKLENHEMLKYQSNLITFPEVRRAIGKTVKDVEQEQLYNNVVTIPAVKAEVEAKADAQIRVNQANTEAQSKYKTGQGNGKTKTTDKGVKKATSTLNRPANQYGTTSVKVREHVSINENNSDSVNNLRKKYENIFSTYENICENIVINKADTDIILPIGRDKILSEFYLYVQKEIQEGASDAVKDITGSENPVYCSLCTAEINNAIKTVVTSLFVDIKKDLQESKKEFVSADIVSVFDKYRYRLDFVSSHLLTKSYWYSYIKTAEYYGIEKVEIDFSSEQDMTNNPKIIETKNVVMDIIPAFHPFCKCTVKLIEPDSE